MPYECLWSVYISNCIQSSNDYKQLMCIRVYGASVCVRLYGKSNSPYFFRYCCCCWMCKANRRAARKLAHNVLCYHTVAVTVTVTIAAAIYTMLFFLPLSRILARAQSMIRQFPFSQVQHLSKCVRCVSSTSLSLHIDGMCPFPHCVSLSLYVSLCVYVKLGDWERVDIEMEWGGR